MKSLFLAAGLAAFAVGASGAAHASARDLEGHWRTDRDDSGITDLDIRFQGYTFDVHAAGQCGRDNCDWGQATGTVIVAPGGRDATDAIGFTTAFDSDDSNKQVFVVFTGGDRLQVITIRVPRNGHHPAVWTTDNFRRDDRGGNHGGYRGDDDRRGPPGPPPPPPNDYGH